MNVDTPLCALLLSAALLFPACHRDAKTELSAWKDRACRCEEHSCATKQRHAFWRLVQEFRDDNPSKARAKQLGSLIEEGQACLENMRVDIYAVN